MTKKLAYSFASLRADEFELSSSLLVAHDALWHRVAPRASNLNKIRSAKLTLVRVLLPKITSTKSQTNYKF